MTRTTFRDVVEAAQFHRRRADFVSWQRSDVPKVFDITVAHAGATKTPAKGLPGHGQHSKPRLVGEPVDTVPGLITTYGLRLADGQDLEQLASHTNALRDNFGAHAVRFEQAHAGSELYAGAGKMTHLMHVVSADPLPPGLTWRWDDLHNEAGELVERGHASWRTRPVPAVGFAMTELLRPLEMPLTGAHVLVGGKTGSGKSYTMLSLACALAVWQPDASAASRCVALCVADMKDTFANTLAPRAALVARTSRDIDAMFKALRDYFRTRQAGRSSMAPLIWPTPDQPAVWIFLDELASWLEAEDGDRSERLRLLGDAARTMREAGGVLCIGVQHPYADILPNSIRGNVSYALCHRMNRHEEVKLVLGPGWSTYVGMHEVQAAGNGEFFYTRDAAVGGPGADDERGRVLRARGLFLDVERGEATNVLRFSRRFMPDMSELRNLYAFHGGSMAA